MRATVAVALSALAVSSLAGTAAALAAPVLQRAATIPARVAADGDWAAWIRNGRVVVLNDATKATSPRVTGIGVASTCPSLAAGSGLVALNCIGPTGPQPRLYDLQTMTQRPTAAPDRLTELIRQASATAGSYNLLGVGRHLLQYRLAGTGPAADFDLFYDWTAGSAVNGTGAIRPTTTQAIDLDQGSAVRQLCDPVRLSSRGALWPNDVSEFANPNARYRAGFVAYRIGTGGVALQHCGRRRVTTLVTKAPAKRAALPYVLTNRFIAWVTGSQVHVRKLTGKQRHQKWSPSEGSISAIQATSKRLFVTTVGTRTRTYVLQVR